MPTPATPEAKGAPGWGGASIVAVQLDDPVEFRQPAGARVAGHRSLPRGEKAASNHEQGNRVAIDIGSDGAACHHRPEVVAQQLHAAMRTEVALNEPLRECLSQARVRLDGGHDGHRVVEEALEGCGDHRERLGGHSPAVPRTSAGSRAFRGPSPAMTAAWSSPTLSPK